MTVSGIFNDHGCCTVVRLGRVIPLAGSPEQNHSGQAQLESVTAVLTLDDERCGRRLKLLEGSGQKCQRLVLEAQQRAKSEHTRRARLSRLWSSCARENYGDPQSGQ